MYIQKDEDFFLNVYIVTGATPTSHGFDKAFNGFLYEHGYVGGAVAAMKDGRLLFAKGFGEDRNGQQVSYIVDHPDTAKIGLLHFTALNGNVNLSIYKFFNKIKLQKRG